MPIKVSFYIQSHISLSETVNMLLTFEVGVLFFEAMTKHVFQFG
jgi:hypothetical protein